MRLTCWGTAARAMSAWAARAWLRAAIRRISAFHENATVTDEDVTHTGTAAIGTWLSTAAGEFTFTTERLGAERLDDTHWVVTNRLEGDFPGGRADLRYRFALRSGLIEDLTIAP
ncbi:nuclear transport factor 2 family protein [Streptomyces sp. NPDC051569]|uniref:nuclear transport factor 2 family protein n=1 Tax=Streptomyces sp. NPDC051569 TaxID=3365661 RepID=UPI0037A906AC